MEEEGGDLLGSQSDAIELVDVVENRKVLTDGADLAGSRPHGNRQLFLCLPCVFGRVRTRIAKLGQSDTGVTVAVCVFIVEKKSHFLPTIFTLTRYVIHPGTICALLICEVAKSVTEVTPISLQVLSSALETIFVVLCILPLLQLGLAERGMYLRLEHLPLLLFKRRTVALKIITAASLLTTGGANAVVEASPSAAVAFPAEVALKYDGVLLVGVEVAGLLTHRPPRRHRQPGNAEQVLNLVRFLLHPKGKLSI